MNNILQDRTTSTSLLSEPNLQNASSLLALLHGKSDSICRLFDKEIIVGKNDLKSLNDLMIDKLSLHNVSTITTTLDVTFSNKRIITFKSWLEFEEYDFSIINSATKSVFIQWDFLAEINNFEVPQRHTVNVRISSTPNPSDFFKVLLNGGFDEAHNFDIQSCTMLCKVDFVNNTLAEELVNVAEHWNNLCESAYSKKGVIRPFLNAHRNLFARFFDWCLLLSLMVLIAIFVKVGIQNKVVMVTNEFILYALIMIIPLSSLIKAIAHLGGKKIFNAFGNLMETHIFKLSRGDDKECERIEKASKFGKELTAFIINTAISIILSIIFFYLE